MATRPSTEDSTPTTNYSGLPTTITATQERNDDFVSGAYFDVDADADANADANADGNADGNANAKVDVVIDSNSNFDSNADTNSLDNFKLPEEWQRSRSEVPTPPIPTSELSTHPKFSTELHKQPQRIASAVFIKDLSNYLGTVTLLLVRTLKD